MAPKRKATARKSKPRKKAATKKKAIKPARQPSPLALEFINNSRFPRDVWYQIIEECDIITQTVLGVTCKTFREIYLKVVEKRGLNDITPIPVIDLSYEIIFTDGTLITLRSCLANWTGPPEAKRIWNPWLEKWCNPAKMAEFLRENGLTAQYGQQLLEYIEEEKELRQRERQELKDKRQDARIEENQGKERRREEKSQQQENDDYYREETEGYDHEFVVDEDSDEISSNESLESGEEVESDEEAFWASDLEDGMEGA